MVDDAMFVFPIDASQKPTVNSGYSSQAKKNVRALMRTRASFNEQYDGFPRPRSSRSSDRGRTLEGRRSCGNGRRRPEIGRERDRALTIAVAQNGTPQTHNGSRPPARGSGNYTYSHAPLPVTIEESKKPKARVKRLIIQFLAFDDFYSYPGAILKYGKSSWH